MMEKIKELKKLNAAYQAALEWDYCPDSDKVEEVMDVIGNHLSVEDLSVALEEAQGMRPDEIASSISQLINDL